MAASEPGSVRVVLRHYGREMVRHKRFAAPALLLPALGVICQRYLAPLLVAQLAGRLVGGQQAGVVTPYVLGFAGLVLLAEVLWRIGLHCINRVDGYGIEDLYHRGMDELLAKDAAFFHDNFAGSLTKRVTSFATRFEPFVDTLAFDVTANLVPLAFAAVVLWTYDPMLVVVLIGLIAVTGVLIAPLVRRRQGLVQRREAATALVAGRVADTLANMETVRAFAAERREAAEHRTRVAEQRRLSIASWDYTNLRIDTVVAVASVLTNGLGLLLAVQLGGGRLGIEAIVVTLAYYTTATQIMFEFNQVYRRLESTLTEAAQFTELLAQPPTVLDPAAPQPVPSGGCGVRFEQVTFTHAGQRQPLFTGLDLDVPAGAKVGFVGRSGGGKTTLTRLLLRLMDVDAGRILIGGQDITRLRQTDLRGLIASVPQDPAMFHRTLRENIAFGRDGATDAELERAAHAAHVTEFVADLPDGFDTVVGERGVKLSGGQRQRVALARAILRDAPILLLDEATSALDSASELRIQDALWRLMQDRTTLVVAHRLSTVVRMDRLVVLEHGRIVEQGTHAELLATGGVYAGLWHHQSGGFLTDDTDDTDNSSDTASYASLPDR